MYDHIRVSCRLRCCRIYCKLRYWQSHASRSALWESCTSSFDEIFAYHWWTSRRQVEHESFFAFVLLCRDLVQVCAFHLVSKWSLDRKVVWDSKCDCCSNVLTCFIESSAYRRNARTSANSQNSLRRQNESSDNTRESHSTRCRASCVAHRSRHDDLCCHFVIEWRLERYCHQWH